MQFRRISASHTVHGLVLAILLLGGAQAVSSQVMLDADGPGDTYELINQALAPGANAVENPECAHPEFGRHVAEVWDAELNQHVFEFYIHVTPDNDRCLYFDRQRMEIKTYASSPADRIGTPGETITYKWKFRLPAGFQPSPNFTHIHQIKAVGGDDGDPIFTITVRTGTPNRIELRHHSTTNLAIAPLSQFEGTWVECTETITVGAVGSYAMHITRVSDGAVLLSYSNASINTIRADNDFIRPKWGIYRSLLSPSYLRDEAVRFAGFFIQEGTSSAAGHDGQVPLYATLDPNFPNPFNPKTTIGFTLPGQADIRVSIHDLLGREVSVLTEGSYDPGHHTVDWDPATEASGVYLVRLRTGAATVQRRILLLR